MNANIQFNTCDPERLESFLSGELTAGEERDVTAHLSTCEICRRALEERAAEPELWSEAQELLRPSEFNRDATRPGARHPLEIQHVLGSLKPTDDPEMLGRIGGYEVSGVVGSGGMGVVLKAVDRSLDRTVAIKVLSPHLASSGAARKRFSREAKAAAAVLHPNVIAIHSVSNDEDLPYLIMPYVRGTSLQKRIDREGPLSLQEILRIGSQIAAGLTAAHAQGLVHRDIKPANILLEDGVERVTITDFGLARAVDDATITHSGVIAGTPQYMSPEQARGESVGQQSDLFSLGSVLYATCTGRPPFRAETSYGIMRRITDDEPTPIREINPDIPEWLCTIVSRLMSKRAVDRFATADEVQELLETCLAHVQQPSAVPLPKSLVPKSSSGRGFFGSRKRFIASCGAIGALVLGMIFWQATTPPDISGNWTGTEWGTVELQQTEPGKYTGSYNDTFGKERGSLGLKWSRIERRFNGTWSEGKERFGKISVRLVDDEIRGAWTTSKESEIRSGIPRLADLMWVRNRVSSSNPTANGEVPQLHPQQDEHSTTDRNVPTTTAEKALARLVLVFFRDRARRAIPAVLIEAGDQTLVVAASPAGVTPDGFEPAVDRAFLEISATSPVEATFLRESTKELNIYLVDRKLDGAYRPDPSLKLNDGDRLSVASFENSRQFHLEPDHVRIVSRAATAQLNLADRGIRHTYDNLIEIDRTLQEGTPLFKDGKLAGLTLLGIRFLGENSGKSYAVPVSRIVEFCEKTLPNILQPNAGDREKPHAVEPPSQIEVIRALAEKEGFEKEALTNLYSKHRDNFRIVVEQVYDKVDPPRHFPLVGLARLHRVRFKCTVFFTETTEAKWPVDTKTEKEISRVVNIDVDHLDVVDADVAQPESPVERLTAKQAVERGQELYYSRKKVTVRFKVAGVVTIKVTDENGETSEWWKLMAEGTEDFSAKMSPELQSLYQKEGIVDLNQHFKGKEIAVQGEIHAVGLRLISRPDTIWTYHIDVTSHDQIRETREERDSSIRQFDVEGDVTAIACSPDGKLLAVLKGEPEIRMPRSAPRTVEFVDADTGTMIRTIALHTQAEKDILAGSDWLPPMSYMPRAFSPDGKLFAISAGLGRVKIFNVETGELIRSLDDEQAKLAEQTTPEALKALNRAMGDVRLLRFSPDGRLLATSGLSFDDVAQTWGGARQLVRRTTGPGRLKVWDVSTGELKYDLVGHSEVTPIAFSADGSLLASGGRWSSEEDDGIGVLLWKMDSGEKVNTIAIESNGELYDLSFAPNRDRVLITSMQFDPGKSFPSLSICLADARSGAKMWQQTTADYLSILAFTTDGQRILQFGQQSGIHVLDAESGNLVRTIEEPSALTSRTFDWPATSFSMQAQRYAKVGRQFGRPLTIFVWDFDLPGAAAEQRPSDAETDGKTSQSGRNNVHTFEAAGEVHAIAATPDGEMLAILNAGDMSAPPGMSKQTVDLVEAATGTVIRSFELQTKAEDEILASSDWLPETTDWPMAISADAKSLAVTAGFGRVKIFNLETGELIHSLDDEPAKLAEKTTPESLKSLKRAMGCVQHLSFSPDGSLLVTSGESFEDVARNWGGINRLGRLVTGSGRLKVWDFKTGALKYDLVGHSHAGPVAFSSDGTLLASGGRWDSGDDHGIGVHVWDVATGEKLRTIGIDSNGFVLDVEFAPDRNLLLVSSVEFDKENDTRSQSISVMNARSGVVEWRRTFAGVPHEVAFPAKDRQVLRFVPGVGIESYDLMTGELNAVVEQAEFDNATISRWGGFAYSPQADRVFRVGVRSGEPDLIVSWIPQERESAILDVFEAADEMVRSAESETDGARRLQKMRDAAAEYERLYQKHRSQMTGLRARLSQAFCLESIGEREQATAIFNELLELPETNTQIESMKTNLRRHLKEMPQPVDPVEPLPE